MSEAFTQHAEQISRHAAPNSSEEKAGVLDFRAMPGEVSGWEQRVVIPPVILKDGLAFHTLEPEAGGATVHIQDTVDAVGRSAGRYGTEAEFTRGRGEFVGTQKSDGTDREQRDDARRAYQEVIQAAVERKGRHLAQTWDDVRARWEPQLPLAKLRKTWPYQPQEQTIDYDYAVEQRGRIPNVSRYFRHGTDGGRAKEGHIRGHGLPAQ